ncbi:uncharacterized protein LOC133796247 [Humulus lupulus]|uniref:uncharacterized protein LOC133796247 n=1 Tax=Humulus lupulus TaxID=3486 RepID=UPI002B40B08D|nr:uncharacterized protein LOC133796247 [Humulus lupulus]
MGEFQILSWNVRGMNKKDKQRSLSAFCRLNKIGLGAFLETKLRGAKLEESMGSYLDGWTYYKGTKSEGRILLIWKSNLLTVEILQESDQYVHTFIKELVSVREYCVTFVYGRNTILERVQLWQDLSCLSFPAKPWLLAGDFNSVFEVDDRLRARPVSSVELIDAQRWKTLGLADDLRSMGSHYTWTNNQNDGARIYSKLDRIFKNEEWVDMFPDSVVVVNWDIFSNHCFCIIKSLTEVNTGVKPFRFFNMWADHEGFKTTVMQNWNKPVDAQGLDRVMVKLRRLTLVLRHFNKYVIGNIDHKFQVAKDRYNHAHLQLQQDPHSAVFQDEEQNALGNLV